MIRIPEIAIYVLISSAYPKFIAALWHLPKDDTTIDAYANPTKAAIPCMFDNFVSIGMNGAGPTKRNAMAIDTFPQMDKIAGYWILSLI